MRDHSKFALHTIRQEPLARALGVPIEAHLGSVWAGDLVERVLQHNDIDTIYHAAAHKYVPLVEGGLVTIIHPDVARTFMQVAEAAQLVIQADAMARGGDVFVLDMGAPVKVVDLARSMIALSGRTERTSHNPSGDIDIEFIGLHPGEKPHEELLTDGQASPSKHQRSL